jgi:predicted PurR-regulated permease PerM
MTWGIVLFLFALILIIFLLLPLTLQINDLEKKMNKFIESLDKRYSTERLRKAQIEKQGIKEKLQERVKRITR